MKINIFKSSTREWLTSFPTENFDSYPTGDLNANNGGTGWSEAWGVTGGCDVNVDVENTTVQGGANAAQEVGVDKNCFRKFTANSTNNTVASWYVRNQTDTTHSGTTWWYNAAGALQIAFYIGSTGQLATYNNLTLTNIQAYSADTWYQIEVEFDYTNEKHRTRINGGAWSAWMFMYDYTTTNHTETNKVRLSGDGASAATYWDSFSDTTPAPSNATKRVLGLLGVGQ